MHPFPIRAYKLFVLLVALPCYSGDVHLLLKNLRWQADLCGQQQTSAILSCGQLGPIVNQLSEAAERAFKKVYYFGYPIPPRQGWPQGPNWVFQHTARFMQQFGSPWLFLEPDAIPLKPDWLQQLDREYRRAGKPFMGPQVPTYGHINGVSVYPANTPQMLPSAMSATDYAWDTACAPQMVPRCHIANHLIAHLWGVLNGKIVPFDGVPPRWMTQESLHSIPHGAVLAHRDKAGTIIDRLREQRNGGKLEICTMQHARTDIFIVSYDKDIQWLEWNLKSIRKFCSGFGQVNVLVPTDQRQMFRGLQSRYSFTLLDYETPTDNAKHHIAHQLQKCKADLWCPDADFILFTDSDCVFTEPVTPEDYFEDGKPVLCVRPYEMSGGGEQWKPTVDACLGGDSKYETMARHPACHDRKMFDYFRKFVENHTGKPFDDYVLGCKAEFPWGFSEFNALGNFVLQSAFIHQYRIVYLQREPRPKDKLTQHWSHSPPDAEQTLPSTGERAVPQEMFDKILA